MTRFWDWYRVQQRAAAEIGLLPWQFDRLTPAELDDLVEGDRERDLRQWQHDAWLVAHLMNISGKSLKKGTRIKPADLLPKPKPVRQTPE